MKFLTSLDFYLCNLILNHKFLIDFHVLSSASFHCRLKNDVRKATYTLQGNVLCFLPALLLVFALLNINVYVCVLTRIYAEHKKLTIHVLLIQTS